MSYSPPANNAINFDVSAYTPPATNAIDFDIDPVSVATGTLTVTLGRVTLSGSGAVAVAGTLAETLGRVTLSGTATVTSPVIGTLALTLGRVSLSGTAAVTTPAVVSNLGAGMWLRDWARRRYEEEELLVLNG